MVMKKIAKYMITAAVAVLSAACISEKESVHPAGELQEMVFSAVYDVATKTVLTDNNDVYWLPGDRIAVSGAAEPFVASAQEQEYKTSFAGTAAAAADYYAVYPYELFESWNGSVAVVDLPQNQTAVKGSFAEDFNIAVAATEASDKELRFKNVLGYVKFTISETSGKVNSIVISSNAGEPLSGSVTVDCAADSPAAAATRESASSVTLAADSSLEPGDYYAALLPGVYEKGLTFTFVDEAGEKSIYNFNQKMQVNAGSIKNIGTVTDLETVMKKGFFHRSLAMRFTADWCGYCPTMNASLIEAKNTSEGKLEVVSMYAPNSNSSKLRFQSFDPFFNRFQIGGFPTAIVDARVDVPNYTSTSFMAWLVNALGTETETAYPTKTGIALGTTLTGSTLEADVKVYAKKADDYKVSVILLEDDMIASQSDYNNGTQSEYEHDNVARMMISDVSGDAFKATSDRYVWQKTYKVEIPADCNTSNLKVLVYVEKPYGNQEIVTGYDENYNGLVYGDYGDTYIDNSLSAKVGEKAALKFTE